MWMCDLEPVELLRLLRGAAQPCQNIAHDVDGSRAEQSVAPVDCSVVHVQESVVRNTGGALGARRGTADRRPKAAVGKAVLKTKGSGGGPEPADAARDAAAGVVQRWWRGSSGARAARAAAAPSPPLAAAPAIKMTKGKAKQGAEILTEAIRVAEREAAELASAALVESFKAELVPVLNAVAEKLGKRAVVAALGRLRDGAQLALGQGSSTAVWVQFAADAEDALGSDCDDSG
ncbi:unnamed protein product [Prorocentrum cordatum]|uniref:Uncharacterized protein n=1 Tax=Prorocentrum cordatum TaxID=2364126 RepID=A0ABN9Y0K4_9DINO|nr:unnamed protein product [Polarella glacialis]